MTAETKDGKRPLNLALQGGGSHGAFTWGVLDRILEDDDLVITGISGTSAGALNAAVLATGLRSGGAPGARKALTEFWRDISKSGSIFAPFSGSQQTALRENLNLDKLPGYQWMSSFFRSMSPYEFNPLNLNPLRDVLRRHIDVQALQSGAPKLFVTATNVTTGQARVFTGAETTLESLLASA
ncbi:MAG: patatin, partial [Rhizobacter sp.]|nr:patatin [Rhizobacter sp.]